jgi:hypothetical protein
VHVRMKRSIPHVYVFRSKVYIQNERRCSSYVAWSGASVICRNCDLTLSIYCDKLPCMSMSRRSWRSVRTLRIRLAQTIRTRKLNWAEQTLLLLYKLDLTTIKTYVVDLRKLWLAIAADGLVIVTKLCLNHSEHTVKKEAIHTTIAFWVPPEMRLTT